MPEPATPSHVFDAFRAAALRRTRALGERIPELDGLSADAAAAVDAPMAAVSLVTDGGQHYAGASGALERCGDAPLPDSFCRHVVDGRSALEISDAREDPRVAESALIAELGVVAYLGVPLVGRQGVSYGALCAVDSQPRAWTSADTAALEQLASAAVDVLDARREDEEERLRAGARELQGQVLAAVAAGAPLTEVLELVTRRIQGERPDALVSILLVDEDGRLRHGAAPDLPAAYAEAVDGIAIGPEAGCGTAAYTGEPVLVADVTADPRWAGYWPLALTCGLRACWSLPVRAADGTVLASLAMYRSDPALPTPDDLALLEQGCALTAIAVEHTLARDRLRASEARHRAIVETIVDGVVSIDVRGVITAVNPAAEALFGYSADELTGRPVTVLMPERYRDAHTMGLSRATQAEAPHAGRRELVVEGLRRDGSEFPLSVSVGEWRGHGEQRSFTAILKDITRQKTTEDELRRSAMAQRRLAKAQTELAHEQAALRRVATAIANELEPARVFDLVARECAKLLEVELVTVGRFVRDDELLLLGTWCPPDAEIQRPGTRLPVSADGVLGAVRASGKVERSPLSPRASLPYGHGMAAPVHIGGRLWGVVAAATNDTAAFGRRAAGRLERFAELTGTAIANADARAALAARASTDPLTGLPNHRTFHDCLRAAVEQAREAGSALSLVVFDLDRFKAVNDTHGHQAGDGVLIETAERLRRHADDGVLGRVGGEEFALLLPGLDAARALARAEAARATIAGEPFGEIGRMEISAGVCDLRDADTPERLYKLADGALYWAKAHGRNSCVRYSPDGVDELSAEERAERLERRQALTSLRVLARAIDAKDHSTQRHSERVADLAARIAAALGWPVDRIEQLRDAGLVHDVGKIGIPDSILLKTGRLEADEYEQIKTHAVLGAQMVDDVLLDEQITWIRHHHERMDGGGYPDGLAGEQIPEGARILALADAWDSMTSARTYQGARSDAEALEECRACSGTHFCPDALAALERLLASGLAAARRAA